MLPILTALPVPSPVGSSPNSTVANLGLGGGGGGIANQATTTRAEGLFNICFVFHSEKKIPSIHAIFATPALSTRLEQPKSLTS